MIVTYKEIIDCLDRCKEIIEDLDYPSNYYAVTVQNMIDKLKKEQQSSTDNFLKN